LPSLKCFIGVLGNIDLWSVLIEPSIIEQLVVSLLQPLFDHRQSLVSVIHSVILWGFPRGYRVGHGAPTSAEQSPSSHQPDPSAGPHRWHGSVGASGYCLGSHRRHSLRRSSAWPTPVRYTPRPSHGTGHCVFGTPHHPR